MSLGPSDFCRYGARTIRTKVHRNLPEFLVEYPDLPSNPNKWPQEPPAPIDWEALLKIVLSNKAVRRDFRPGVYVIRLQNVVTFIKSLNGGYTEARAS